ncbi:MAG TPA: PPOX class F420-dependent oxidoreductase [Spongiibacteraceae bacterium]|jgi:PPOX class probable F420-dependent enzyme|nr:PPOX class F420-dependent oxidoreductase [Spongiibacteraceae bacterium]HUH37231.1 PPOX class F420-dependent oxidoreductase [Spongiibacteraceae bacterium]
MDIPATHRDILHSKCFAHAATLRPDGRLSVHPVTVLLRNGQVCFSTLKSRGKYRNLVRDPRLSLSIPHPENPWHYLELRGLARLEDDPRREVIDQIARKYLGQDHYPYDAPGDERVTVILDIEQVWAPAIHGATDESLSALRSQVYGDASS